MQPEMRVSFQGRAMHFPRSSLFPLSLSPLSFPLFSFRCSLFLSLSRCCECAHERRIRTGSEVEGGLHRCIWKGGRERYAGTIRFENKSGKSAIRLISSVLSHGSFQWGTRTTVPCYAQTRSSVSEGVFMFNCTFASGNQMSELQV